MEGRFSLKEGQPRCMQGMGHVEDCTSSQDRQHLIQTPPVDLVMKLGEDGMP